MNRWFKISAMLLFFISFTLGCTSELPYLNIDVESTYTSSNISIPYSFNSEQSSQPCKIQLSPSDGRDDTSDDWFKADWMENTGTLYYEDLPVGDYELRFVVLSARGSNWAELSFLDQTHSFSVSY